MENNVKELAVNIKYCPYCGSDVVEAVNEVDLYCMDCGKDFRIMTQLESYDTQIAQLE